MTAPRLFHRLDDVGADAAATAFCEALAGDGIALAIAVVPGWLTPGHARRLARLPGITVLQHGARHINRRRLGFPDEFPDGMPVGPMRREIQDGRHRLEDAFGRRIAVYAPPWNRASSKLGRVLDEAGFTALSGHRRFPVPAPLGDLGVSIDTCRRYAPLRLAALPAVVAAVAARAAAHPDTPHGVFYHVDGLSGAEWRRALDMARHLARLYPVAPLMEAGAAHAA